MKNKYENNIYKLFFYMLSQRRHYVPILSIYFLTLPNTTAKQIGIFMGAGSLMSFLLEIPSGYFADRFGHKKSLVLAKIIMILSLILFIFARNLYYFIFAAIFLATSHALGSGTKEAFLYETLIKIKRQKEYSKIMGKLSANVSIISMIFIVLLPFFTKISIVLPLKINLIFDIIGLFFVISLTCTNNKIKQNHKSILQIIRESKKKRFFSFAIFAGAIPGFMLVDFSYRYVYLESLNYPIIFIGFVMGFSRLIWFIVGHYAYYIEKILTKKKHLFIEMFLFPTYYILVAFFSNPYLIGLIFSIVNGYQWGRKQVIDNYILNDYIKDKRYKATSLSIIGQIRNFVNFSFVIPLGFIMHYSYKAGFYTMGILLFIILTSSYYFIRKH
jgi:MFS family permease